MTLGVRVVVEDGEGRVLLVRHTYVKGWYLPGGGVEVGETQAAAAKKELLEETGILCDGEPELIGVYLNLTASRRDHVSLYRCRKWSQAKVFNPNKEIAEIGFYAISDLPDGVTPGTLRRIEEVYGGNERSELW